MLCLSIAISTLKSRRSNVRMGARVWRHVRVTSEHNFRWYVIFVSVKCMVRGISVRSGWN